MHELEHLSRGTGWAQVAGNPALVQFNARYLRTCEPRYDAFAFPLRSTFAFSPDYQHPSGEWWQLEDKFDEQTGSWKVVLVGVEGEMNDILNFSVTSAHDHQSLPVTLRGGDSVGLVQPSNIL